MVHRPAWFRDGSVFVSFADTVGINKDGNTLFTRDRSTGKRTDTVDDKVAIDVAALREGRVGPTSRWVPSEDFSVGVPNYYSDQYAADLRELLERPEYKGLVARRLGDLIDDAQVVARAGHGSPSADLRDGDVPYIKVSDIRAGQININPTNMVSRVVAERFWRGDRSSLESYDLVTPVRASKNIGEFATLMPGQEDIVLTKEVLVLRAAQDSTVDNFYLMWALSLKAVRSQWKRVVFMQTNREDVGRRYLEIEIPWPADADTARSLSQAFREYFEGLQELRRKFVSSLAMTSDHHIFLGSSEPDAAHD